MPAPIPEVPVPVSSPAVIPSAAPTSPDELVPGSSSALLAARYGAQASAPADAVNPTIAGLLDHRSVRAYLPTPVSDAEVAAIVAAAQSAATSSNLQLWSVIAVRDAGRRAELAELAGGQAHVVEAPLLLVWLADLGRAHALAARHDAPTEGGEFLETAVVGIVDAALAAQNAAVAAESLGLGTVYLGALRNHPGEVARVLGLPAHVVAVFGLVVGRPDPERPSRVKPRLPQEAVLHHETYDESAHEAVDAYEERIAAFYAQEGLAHSWVDRVLARLASRRALNGRDRLADELRERGFPLR